MDIKIPIGQSDFAAIITEGFTWVDKSLFIKEIIDDSSLVILFTRPRRFGKTLNLSMLRYFFAKQVNNINTAELFHNTQLNQQAPEYCQQHQGQYPVIFLTLKDIKSTNYSAAYEEFKTIIADLYQQHRELLTIDKLYDEEKERFHAILNETANPTHVKYALKYLIDFLHRQYGRKPIVLIDEYDTPIQEGYLNGYYDEVVNFMRSFLGASLKDNIHLGKAILTGILRISRESLFSDLNNIEVYSSLRAEYASYFGFTEQDVDNLLALSKTNIDKTALKEWYNGYQLGNNIIYNPWSILNCFKQKGTMRPYWINTSQNKLIQTLLIKSNDGIKTALASLLKNQQLEKVINENMVFPDLENNEAALWTLLLMTGYLKASATKIEHGNTVCLLEVPNKEVLGLYENIINDWLSGGKTILKQDNFINNLLIGNLSAFEQQLRDIMLQIVSAHDVSHHQQESFYHGLLLGTIVFIDKQQYEVKSNRESGEGRYDIAIIPHDPTKQGIILELKSIKPDNNKTKLLEQTAKSALKQINSRQYHAELLQRGIKKILKVGIAFSGKNLSVCCQ